MGSIREKAIELKKLSCLNKATVSYEYLHTNSTTHEFVFGAMAELVDNSRDADATSLHIDFDKRRETLSFLDNGCGMTPDETTDVVCFGHSKKRMSVDKIGQYGNGLKSGSMRIANDFMIFTKKDTYSTALLLSRTFHEASGITDILVPAPVFSKDLDAITDNPAKHEMEMELIHQYSPFKTLRDLKEQFDKIKDDHGTMIVLFNLRRIENGNFELNFEDNPHDIGLSDNVDERENEKNSLRAYLSVLYLSPYTKIYLRGKKVNTIRIQNTLALVCTYDYYAKNLKGCADKEVQLCMRRIQHERDKLSMMTSEYGDLMQMSREKEAAGGQFDKEEIVRQRKLNMKIEEQKELVKECEKKAAKAAEVKKNPAPLKFTFGLNIHHRNKYGCMIYNNGRLIEMYVKLPVQEESNDVFMKCLGVVGLVDIPYSVLEPTHNKQSFEDKKEFQSVLRAMNTHMASYWEDIISIIGRAPSAVKKLWETFGYEDCAYGSEVNRNFETKKDRYKKTGHCIQCDYCLKWRMMPCNEDYVLDGVPENWTCLNNPIGDKRGCIVPEKTNVLENGKPGKLRPAGFEMEKSLLASANRGDPIRFLFEKWSTRKPFTYEPEEKPLITPRARETTRRSVRSENVRKEAVAGPPLVEPKTEPEDEEYDRQPRRPLATMSARKQKNEPLPTENPPRRPLATMSARKQKDDPRPPTEDEPKRPYRFPTMSARIGDRVMPGEVRPPDSLPRRPLATMSARKQKDDSPLSSESSESPPRRRLATMSARKSGFVPRTPSPYKPYVAAWMARKDAEREERKKQEKKKDELAGGGSPRQKHHRRGLGYLMSSDSDSDAEDRIEQKYQPSATEKRKAAAETRKSTGMGDTLNSIGRFTLNTSSESEGERGDAPPPSEEKVKISESTEKTVKKMRIEETPSPVIQKSNVSDGEKEEIAKQAAELEAVRREIEEMKAQLEKTTNETEKMKEELSKMEQEKATAIPHFTEAYPTEELLTRDVVRFMEWIEQGETFPLSKEVKESTAYSMMHEVATRLKEYVEKADPPDAPDAPEAEA